APNLSMTGFTGFTTPTGNAVFYREEHIYTCRDDLTTVKGRHILKFGALNLFNSQNNLPASGDATHGAVTFSTAAANSSKNVIADVLLGNFRTYTESAFPPRSMGRGNTWEFYAQDTWRASRKLTLDYGLRYSLMFPDWDALIPSPSFEPKFFKP